MSEASKSNPEVQPKPERRIVAEAEQCKHGELGALLRLYGITYAQISKWRTAAAGTLDKKRGPVANPNRVEVRRS